MSTTARPLQNAPSRDVPGGRSDAVRRKSKIAAVLVTLDDGLWPQIGKFVPGQFALKQVDSIEQFLNESEPGAAAVLIWDARDESGPIERLALLQQHSSRLAVLALDTAPKSSDWDALIRTQQVTALVTIPIGEGEFVKSLNRAGDDVQARCALLGDSPGSVGTGVADDSVATPGVPTPSAANTAAASKISATPSRKSWIIGAAAAVVLVLVAAIAAMSFHRRPNAPEPVSTAPGVATPGEATSGVATPGVAASGSPAAAIPPSTSATLSEQVEDLLEKAGQAMLDRRYVAPADNNALAYYRRVLAFDAHNGEALQGLERMAELLLTRAQSDVDSRQFEPALQALETARSLKPDDPRVKALDIRLANTRAEFGTSQIQAALSAQNFDRAAMLIEEALRVKSITPGQGVQWRDALKRQRDDYDIARFIKLAEARLQQGRLTEPDDDSAAYYLERARHAGASAADIAADARVLSQRVAARNQEAHDRADAAKAAQAAALAAPAVKPADAVPTTPPAGAAPEASLVLMHPIQPVYPQAAALSGQEGWVELGFTVNAGGRVGNVKVINASPAGVFEQSAVKAMQAATYRPLSTTDPTISRQAKLKLSFRLSK